MPFGYGWLYGANNNQGTALTACAAGSMVGIEVTFEV